MKEKVRGGFFIKAPVKKWSMEGEQKKGKPVGWTEVMRRSM